MQPLSSSEVASLAEALQPLVGAQLQEVVADAIGVSLGFYHQRELHWLCFVADARAPALLLRTNAPHSVHATKVLPVVLFLRAHVRGHRLRLLEQRPGEERVLHLIFAAPPDQTPSEIEIGLLPHAPSFIVHASGKRVGFVHRAGAAQVQRVANDPAVLIAKKIEKKRGVQRKMQAELIEKRDPRWRELGEWLKAHPRDEVPPRLKEIYDSKKGLAWNIENAFQQAKQNERKLIRAEARRLELEQEIIALERASTKIANGVTTEGETESVRAKAEPSSLLHIAKARGRTLQVAPDLVAYVGKSAADNQSLLRAAQPHDLWLHLREQPSAHAIIRRNKNRQVTDQELWSVGEWFILQSIRQSREQLLGQHFDLLVVERRYVRMVKGQGLGHVHYTHARTVRLNVR